MSGLDWSPGGCCCLAGLFDYFPSIGSGGDPEGVFVRFASVNDTGLPSAGSEVTHIDQAGFETVVQTVATICGVNGHVFSYKQQSSTDYFLYANAVSGEFLWGDEIADADGSGRLVIGPDGSGAIIIRRASDSTYRTVTFDSAGYEIRPSAMVFASQNRWINSWLLYPDDVQFGMKGVPFAISVKNFPRATTIVITEYSVDEDWTITPLPISDLYTKNFTLTWAVRAGDVTWDEAGYEDLAVVNDDFTIYQAEVTGEILYRDLGSPDPPPATVDDYARKQIWYVLTRLETGTTGTGTGTNVTSSTTTVRFGNGSTIPVATSTVGFGGGVYNLSVNPVVADNRYKALTPFAGGIAPLHYGDSYNHTSPGQIDIAAFAVGTIASSTSSSVPCGYTYTFDGDYERKLFFGASEVAVALGDLRIQQPHILNHPDAVMAHFTYEGDDDFDTDRTLYVRDHTGTVLWSQANAPGATGTPWIEGTSDRYIYVDSLQRLVTVVGSNLPTFTEADRDSQANLGATTYWKRWAVSIDGARWNPCRYFDTVDSELKPPSLGRGGPFNFGTEFIATSEIPNTPPDDWF